MAFNTTTGTISGNPMIAITASFVVRVTDDNGDTDDQGFFIHVKRGTYEAIISIDSSLKDGETKVFVEGSLVTSLTGSQSAHLNFDVGTSHTVTIDSVVEHPTKDNIKFKAETDRIVISEQSPNAHFSYYTEYFIKLETVPPQVTDLTGSGWYKEEYIFNTHAPTDVEDDSSSDIQYRFTHWLIPTGETVKNDNLSLTISAPGTIIANYDTYYQLTLVSPYGEPEENTWWYKAGSQAEWGVKTAEVPMSGILGFFGGKLKAVNYGNTVTMDAPQTVTVVWEPDYTMPYILIPLSVLLIILVAFGIYKLLLRLQPKPAPVAPPMQAMPAPQTTVVMIGEKTRQTPQTTREQLMEKFGELLQKYEEEITTTIGAKQTEALPEVETISGDKQLTSPEQVPPVVVEGEIVSDDEGAICNFATKKPLRVIVSEWRQVKTSTTDASSQDKEAAESGASLTIVWARDMYQEWEIFTCALTNGHEGNHQGSSEIVYSLLNTVTEEKTYSSKQKVKLPTSHFTDGMTAAEITDDQVVSPEQLPPQTAP